MLSEKCSTYVDDTLSAATNEYQALKNKIEETFICNESQWDKIQFAAFKIELLNDKLVSNS